MPSPTRIRVTESDIVEGVAGDCFRCAVVIAVAREAGGEAMIYEDRDCCLRIEVDGRSVVAPRAVRDFIWAFDDQPRDADNRLDLADPDVEIPEPFEFDLPPPSDPAWEFQCARCGGHFDGDELDDRSECEDCR